MFQLDHEEEEKNKNMKMTRKLKKEIGKHHSIIIRLQDHFFLFFAQYIRLSKKCWNRKEKFQTLYENICDKIDKEFDILAVIKNQNKVSTIVNNSLATPIISDHIEPYTHNIIELSSSCSSSSDEESDNSEKSIDLLELKPISHFDILQNLYKNTVKKRKKTVH